MVLLYIIFSFDNMFQNAFKCDMVSTACSKMLSNATWFRQHVPKCSQMRHAFDNMFQTYQPTNLPTYICIYMYFLCMHNTLVHALEGPGPKARTQQKSGRCTRVLCMHKK